MNTNCPYCRKVADLDQLPPEELVWTFPHAAVLLGSWQFYRGYCVLVLRRHATELSALSAEERRQFLEEMSLTARAIELAFRPRKMNYEMLGNQVPHMHWHLIPRYPDDPEALQAIWLPVELASTDPVLASRLRGDPAGRRETADLIRLQLRKLTQGLT